MDENTQIGPDSNPAVQPNVDGDTDVASSTEAEVVSDTTVSDEAEEAPEELAEEAPAMEDAPEAVDPDAE